MRRGAWALDTVHLRRESARAHPALPRRCPAGSLRDRCPSPALRPAPAFVTTSGFCDNFGYPYYPLYPSDTGYTEPAPAYDSSADNQAALSNEVERLSREVDDLRESERQPRQNNDNNDDKPPVSRPSDLSAPNDPPKALVFKDGHQILVENYVISGNTMWIIDNGHMKKVSLNDIDNAATQKANSDNEFRIRH